MESGELCSYGLEGSAGVVTGAASGIGRAVALRLVQAGARVLAVDTSAGGLARLRGASKGYIEVFEGDVTDSAAAEAYAARALDVFGAVSFFHNNAGVGGVHRRVLDMTADEWRRVMAVNVDGVFFGFKWMLPALIRSGGGSIVVTGSLLSSRGALLRGDYAASKHAVVGLARTVAIEHAQDGVRVNVICPGAIDTPLQAESERLAAPGNPLLERHRLEERAPMGRYGTPEEVAELTTMLLSPVHKYLTGALIPLDGGFGAG